LWDFPDGQTMDDRKKVWYLRRVDLFASLTDGEIGEIAELLGDHHIPTGHDLLGDTHRSDKLILVKEGAVRLQTCDSGQRVSLALLGPGRVFGFSSIVGDDSPLMSATTLAPSYVCFTSWSKMMDVFMRYPQVMVKMTAALAELLFEAETWRARLGMSSPGHRLANLLVELSDEFGEQTIAGRRISFRLTQIDLGSMVGLSRETVSRLMAEFGRQGWVAREEGLLVVRDRAALRNCRGDIDGGPETA
jgi:CRP/FNR family transcriptional regulator